MPPGVADASGVGLVVAAITYASLIIGELVPKQIALRNPEAIAVRVSPAMTVLAKIVSRSSGSSMHQGGWSCVLSPTGLGRRKE